MPVFGLNSTDISLPVIMKSYAMTILSFTLAISIASRFKYLSILNEVRFFIEVFEIFQLCRFISSTILSIILNFEKYK
jgi:hypothetical protein